MLYCNNIYDNKASEKKCNYTPFLHIKLKIELSLSKHAYYNRYMMKTHASQFVNKPSTGGTEKHDHAEDIFCLMLRGEARKPLT